MNSKLKKKINVYQGATKLPSILGKPNVISKHIRSNIINIGIVNTLFSNYVK